MISGSNNQALWSPSILSIWLSIALVVGGHGLELAAHETAAPRPTAEELAATQPGMKGSDPFAQEVLAHLAGQLDEAGLSILDQMQAEYRLRDHIRLGHVPDNTNQMEAEFHRWRGEQRLVDLLTTYAGVIKLDFRAGQTRPDPDAAISLDPQFDVVVFKIVTGDGPTTFRIQDWDLLAEYPNSAFVVDIDPGGTTYVMLKLLNVPEDKNGSLISFREQGTETPLHMHAVSFDAREWGHLAIDVRDENGQPTPVLMRLSTHAGKRLWEPAGSVDLRGVLNEVVPHLALLGRGYMFWLPGDNRGRYWIVARPLEMTLPSGDWDVRLVHGPEYEPLTETLHVDSKKWTRREYRLKRWIDMPSQGWYSGDDHVHARLLNSEDADSLLAYARAVDIYVANILEMGDHLRTWYPQRGFGPEFRVHAGNHWLVPGQEDPRSVLGHAIGLNLQSKVRDLDKYLLNDVLAEEIHRQGGLYGHTHVGANACFAHREMAIFTPMGFVDFNSIMQASLGTELYYDLLNLGYKMTASAGADTPYGGTMGAVRVYAYVGTDQDFSIDKWFSALAKGHTFVTNGPMLDFHIDEAMPGDEITVDSDRELKISVTARGIPGTSAPQRLKLVRSGEVLKEVVASDSQADSLDIKISVPANYGAWIAAHAIGRDGSEAHSTPIYITRKGFRHWNADQAERIIKKQLAILDEVQKALDESRQMVTGRANPFDYWNRLNAAQADLVRERLDRARQEYQQLRTTLASEQAARQ